MWAYHVFRYGLRPPFWGLFRLKVVGAERVPAREPLLVACNHASFLDPWFVGVPFPRSPIRFLINEPWYRRSLILTGVLKASGVIPTIDRRPLATILRVCRSIGRGETVGVFPEGRVSADGRVNVIRHGIGWMAALSGAKVVPCGLRGNFDALPRHRKIPRRHPVELHIGDPIAFPGAPSMPDPDDVHTFVLRLTSAICGLVGRPEQERSARPRAPAVDIRSRLARERGVARAAPTA
jgi:1-acyl-sn-glycerol-3-phosphate acyltransferase